MYSPFRETLVTSKINSLFFSNGFISVGLFSQNNFNAFVEFKVFKSVVVN